MSLALWVTEPSKATWILVGEVCGGDGGILFGFGMASLKEVTLHKVPPLPPEYLLVSSRQSTGSALVS